MKILIVGSFQYEMYAPAFMSGFLELGHTVDWLDTNKYHYRYDFPCHILDRFQAKYYHGFPLRKMNIDIINEVETFKPDFVFFYYCFTVFESTYKRIHELGIKFFTYCNDDPYGKILRKPWCYRFHKSIRLADWNFVYRQKNISDYKKDRINNVSVLLPYYLKKNILLEKCVSILPIAFLGHYEADGRDKYIKALLDNNIPVTVFGGSYWKSAPLYKEIQSCILPGRSGKAYYETINKLQVAIVFLSKLNHDTYTRRCFEIPATKTCMLCEYTDDMNQMFPEDECAVYFHSIKDFIEKAAFLLAHPEECKRIGENAYERLKVIGGNEVDRCKEIIEKYQCL